MKNLEAYIIATRAALRARRIIARIEARRTTVRAWNAHHIAMHAIGDMFDGAPETMRSPTFAKETA